MLAFVFKCAKLAGSCVLIEVLPVIILFPQQLGGAERLEWGACSYNLESRWSDCGCRSS
jgi:hypothetical protein